MAFSFCKCILTNLGGIFFAGTVSINKKYGWWSENCLIKIPAVDWSIIWLSLQNKLSINVPFRSENLVGNVILGKKLNPVKVS